MSMPRYAALVLALCAGLVAFPACSPSSDRRDAAAPESEQAPEIDCEANENLYAQIHCYVTRATGADDPAECRAASHEGVRYQCLSIVAEQREDRDLCDEIPPASPDHEELRDACISDVAKKRLDGAMCADVGTPGLRDGCYARIGQETGDRALCEEIGDPGLKSVCTGEPVTVD